MDYVKFGGGLQMLRNEMDFYKKNLAGLQMLRNEMDFYKKNLATLEVLRNSKHYPIVSTQTSSIRQY